MTATTQRWEALYGQVPFGEVPYHFAGIQRSPYMLRYLCTVLELCPRGARTCETGIGTGYGAIWLSLRGVAAEGIDNAPGIVERARQINHLLGGNAAFHTGDLFDFYQEGAPRYQVVHHQGVLEHFTAPQIQAALAQQVSRAEWVVFCVPSVYYPFEPEFGDERLLPLEEWKRLLQPFDVAELCYFGDPQHAEREHILCVLRGQKPETLRPSLRKAHTLPFPEGISAIVHTRNEARHIADCLETLKPWADEIILCDMESEDDTVEIACRYTNQILHHPRIQNFDRARNVSALRARYRWVFYLDADERVPPGLGPALRQLVESQGETFSAALIPFRHHFAGHWMRCLYPGYTAPRLLKNGQFFFNTRLHSGAIVNGPTVCFPADNPDLALVHYSFDSMAHYLDKLNRYTDGEAANMHRDGTPFHWQRALRHFVQDFQGYYDRGQAHQDSVHGFIYSFLSAFYRFEQHAKLFEHRFREGRLQPEEVQVPGSVREILQTMLAICDEKPLPQAPDIRVQAASESASVVWSGPLYDPSGYGEESRHLIWAMAEAGVSVTAQPLPWSADMVDLTAEEGAALERLAGQTAAPDFLHITHNFAPRFQRHPQAGSAIGRTVFETDRLPADWVKACNRMDTVWVPTEFNRRTFTQAGVEAEKLVVIPECFDPGPYLQPGAVTPLSTKIGEDDTFTFLTLFDWTLHKGWDVLLRSFLEAFEGRDDVQLLLKVWSTMGYSAEYIRQQAEEYVREELGHDLLADLRIQFVQGRFTRSELIGLYQAVDAFVMPSRGEGWGRPYMEAMACGLPTIGTNWSGNTAFMTEENSYLVDADVVPVPEIGWREIVTYKGHCWAEPRREGLRVILQRVVEERGEAQARGKRAQEEITTQFSREQVGPQIAQEIARMQEERRPHPVLVAQPFETSPQPPAAKSGRQSRKERSSKQPVKATPQTTASSAVSSMVSPSLAVRWEGDWFQWHSLAHVNREFCLGLLASGQVELALTPFRAEQFRPEEDSRFPALASRVYAPLSRPAHVHVRHFFPPRLDRPSEGHFVLIQPWEYGYLPERWIEPIQEEVSEVWCYSQYVKEVYRASGIAEEKLHVVPLGVDTTVFTPSVLPHIFTDEAGAGVLSGGKGERFVFLFVGGTLDRKGIDILLEAYTRGFSAYDEVCLVIKDMGTQTVYRGQNAQGRILELVQDTSRPPIVYLDGDMPASQLAGLYTACDCLVQPYRGEGFCLPALEAMACGLPVIVPEGGPTDDFVEETVGWRVPAAKANYGNGRIGEWECVGPTYVFEIHPADLAKQMRRIFQNAQEARAKGNAAAEKVQAGWTWQHAAEKALERIRALREQPLPERKAVISLAVAKTLETKEATTPPKTVPESTGKTSPNAEENTPLSGSVARDRRASTGGKQSAPGAKPEPVASKAARNGRSHPTLSLCMIVKNEERVLGDCLKSVKPHVDEIIVVDTGSTDKTVEIAKKHGAKVSHFPWCDDFSAARNASLEQATCDWIFWMDADDTLPEACGKGLKEVISFAEDRTTGFLMQVHIPPAPGENGFTIVDHVKIFRNLPQLRFERRIHEQILMAISRMDGRVERTGLYVVHSGYDYSPEGQKRKRERDLRILALELAERPDDPFTHFNIGMTHHHLKQFERGIEALERCLALSKPHESTVRKVYALLASSHLEQGDKAQAKAWVEKGLKLYPHDPELLFRAGVVYRECGDLAAAEQSYQTLLTARETGHIDSLDVSMTGFKAYHNLALIYQDRGRFGEAEASFQEALKDHPTFVPSHLGLGELYLQLRRFEDVQAIIKALSAFAPTEASLLHQRFSRHATVRQESSLRQREGPLQFDSHLAQHSEQKKSPITRAREPPERRQPVLLERSGAIIQKEKTGAAQKEGFARLRALFPYPKEKLALSPNDPTPLPDGLTKALARHLGAATQVVLELGAGSGDITRYLASHASHARVIAVDTWRHNSSDPLPNTETEESTLLHETFLANCWPLQERIYPVRLPLHQSLEFLSQWGIGPDLVYLHAQDYNGTRQHLLKALRVFPMATVLGDAYAAEDIQRAVTQVAMVLGLETRFGESQGAWWFVP